MKYILRQAALTAVIFSILYAGVLALSYVLVPEPPHNGSMDVWAAGDTLYLTTPKYAFLGRDTLNVPDRKVVLLGGSNTGTGFRQAQVQALMPCAKVSNLAIGNANISELSEIIDLVHDVQDDAARKTNTFVIGVWFGMFVDTAQRWPGADRQHGDTDIDIERYRYGFYRRTPAGPVPVLPAAWLRAGVVLIRPYLLMEKVARDVTARLRQAVFDRPPELTDADRELIVFKDKDKADALAYWHQTMGPTQAVSAEQVALLQATIDKLLQSGENVVLVDLPLPAWHRDASPYQAGYEKAVQPVFDHFEGRPGFAGLRMADLAADQDYSDEVHPKLHLARVWAARLASVLNPLVCSAEAGSDIVATLQGRPAPVKDAATAR